MVQTIEQGDIFGRIGKSFGQGLGEAIPKAQERRMLSDEITKIGKEPGLSELDRFSRLSRIPGGLENMQYISPLLQQAQQRTDFENLESPREKVSVEESRDQVNGETPKIVSKHLPASKSFKARIGTPEALNARARELIATQPAMYRDPNKAVDKAQQEFDNEVATLASSAKEFDSSLKTRLQKYGKDIDQDIIGDMRQDYEREAQALAATGKASVQKAADLGSEDLLDFAKARTNLKTADVPFLFTTPEKDIQAQKKLQAIRKQYADRDSLELFADDLVNKVGLSSNIADYLAFPVKDNKEINNYAADTKKKFSLNPFQSGKVSQLAYGIKEKGVKGSKKRTEAEIGDFVVDNLKDGDSLNSIATTFNARGYDPQLIFDQIQKRWDEGKRLSKRQAHDLEKRGTFRPTLKDISYFSATGLNPLEVIP